VNATPVSRCEVDVIPASPDGPEITVHYPMGRERTLAYHRAVSELLADVLTDEAYEALEGVVTTQLSEARQETKPFTYDDLVQAYEKIMAAPARVEPVYGTPAQVARYRRLMLDQTVYVVERPEGGYDLLANQDWCPPDVKRLQEEAMERLATPTDIWFRAT
jgi:hypothetical protein